MRRRAFFLALFVIHDLRFMCFNMVLPSTVSVDNIFGSIMKSKFSTKAGMFVIAQPNIF